ncbi:uncharacterized protein LOC125752615 [Canis lupus dingo]|uniref:uncharacterized protein LOC125752615 n=1 Tax=Canis lupus dingo TaxID=286419 RepID=UPI0020C53EE4|nr:uncharacterized protein LOC125752615 [Canis lupus dingo]
MKHHKTRCLELSGSEETGRGRKTFQGRGAAKWGIKATSDCDLERRRRRKMEFLKRLDSTREQRTMMCNLFLLLQRYYRHIAVGNLVSWWNTNSKSNICHHHHHMTSHVTSISTENRSFQLTESMLSPLVVHCTSGTGLWLPLERNRAGDMEMFQQQPQPLSSQRPCRRRSLVWGPTGGMRHIGPGPQTWGGPEPGGPLSRWGP